MKQLQVASKEVAPEESPGLHCVMRSRSSLERLPKLAIRPAQPVQHLVDLIPPHVPWEEGPH